jgi:hypothetical protein
MLVLLLVAVSFGVVMILARRRGGGPVARGVVKGLQQGPKPPRPESGAMYGRFPAMRSRRLPFGRR